MFINEALKQNDDLAEILLHFDLKALISRHYVPGLTSVLGVLICVCKAA